MYKFIVLAAVIAVAAAVPPFYAAHVAHVVPVVHTVVSNQAVAPATVLDSPAGAVASVVGNQVFRGATGITDPAGAGVPVVAAAPAVVVAAPVLAGAHGYGWSH